MNWSAYLRLMRFDRPVGIWLLWYPVAWALWLANDGRPPVFLVVYFFIGTVVMRAAGCIVNDIADRHIDKHVLRTKSRPLTSGEVRLQAAFILLFLLIGIAFFVLVQLPEVCFYYALFALFITALYPFCKRFIAAPQLILGIAFSVAIPMVYAASHKAFNTSGYLLLFINLSWVIAYDTMYALGDRKEDLLIGVKSTAILFGRYNQLIIASLQLVFHALWLLIAWKLHLSRWFYLGWLLAISTLVYQQTLLTRDDSAAFLQAFLNNTWYGLLMWMAVILG